MSALSSKFPPIEVIKQARKIKITGVVTKLPKFSRKSRSSFIQQKSAAYLMRLVNVYARLLDTAGN